MSSSPSGFETSGGGNLKAEIPMMCFRSMSPFTVLYIGAAGLICFMVFSVAASSVGSTRSDLLSSITSEPAICLCLINYIS